MGKGAFQVERTEWIKEGRGKEIFVQEKVLFLNPVLQYWGLGRDEWKDRLEPDDQGPYAPCREFVLHPLGSKGSWEDLRQ